MSGTRLAHRPAVRVTPVTGETAPIQQHSLWRSVVLHLGPGAVFLAFVLAVAPTAQTWGIDPALVLFAGIGLVIAPLELGYLMVHAHRATGSWSPLGAVSYRARIPARRLVPLTIGLAAWFLVLVGLSMAFIDGLLARNVFAWLPDTLLQFSGVDGAGEQTLSTVAIVGMVAVMLVFNGIVGPITEELYFRGHLLPRIDRYGHWSPVISTALFTLYHFFSPWRYPAIFLGMLPMTWVAWRKRSIAVSIAAHMTVNIVTVMLLVASFLAS